MSRTKRKWKQWEEGIEDDDDMYGDTMKNVGKWARQQRDKSTVSPADKWDRASQRAKKKGKRQQEKIDLDRDYI